MKIKLGFYVEEEFELPEKFEFIFTKEEDDYTDEEWVLYWEEFNKWKGEVTGLDGEYDNIEVIG